MDESRSPLVEMLCNDLEAAASKGLCDRKALCFLCSHVIRRIKNGDPVDRETMVTLLKSLQPPEESKKKKKYNELLRGLYHDVMRRIEEDIPVYSRTVLLLLEHLTLPEETDKQEQYSEIFNVIEVRQAKEKCSFYDAVKSYHVWLQDQDRRALSPLQRNLRAKDFSKVFEQLKKARPPRMRIRDARIREQGAVKKRNTHKRDA